MREILKIERIGRFTIVQVAKYFADSPTVYAVGVSRLSHLDRNNDALGVTIATGRANAALDRKLAGQVHMQHPYMA